MLTVRTFVEGPIEANNYLLADEDTKEAILIDCSSDRTEFLKEIKDSDYKLKYILLTHGHFDHILGVNKFVSEFGIDAYMSEQDIEQVKYASQMYLMFSGKTIETEPSIKKFVKDGDEFKIGSHTIKAISTPGHTKGGISYLVDNKLFSGDTLFYGSVGRCDMPGGNFNEIKKSIKEKLFILPDDTEVYTGHGIKTTIGFEKTHNEIVLL